MEIVMNELSLSGQFDTISSFYDSLDSMLKIQKTLDKLELTVLSHSELYSKMVTHEHTLHDALSNQSSKGNDKVRVFKIMLKQLMQGKAFWTESPKHIKSNIYKCNFTDEFYGYGLAEACERDKVVISFKSEEFAFESLEIRKNADILQISNLENNKMMADFLHPYLKNDPYIYCVNKFDGSNLSFEHLEDKYGFSSISSAETDMFISSFQVFSSLSWIDIGKSDGLKYKPYSPNSEKNDWFSGSVYKEKNIFKFRVSERCRCFGYRSEDVFFVLRFEVDHKASNNG